MSATLRQSPQEHRTSQSLTTTADTEPERNQLQRAWMVWLAAFGSSLALWLAFPPVGWSALGWLAPLGWLWIVDRRPSNGRPLAAAYLSGFFYWLITTVWVCLPHQAAVLGWIALSAYLAVYLWAFVGLTRLAVHRCGVPLIVAAPVIWVAMEYLRGFLLSGFGIALLAHTQTYWPQLIQISDLGGAYAVSFLVLTVACSLYLVGKRFLLAKHADSTIPWRSGLLYGLLLLSLTIGYGVFRLSQASQSPGPRIALIQANIPQSLKHGSANAQYIFEQHHNLTLQALEQKPDLIAWPETMYRFPVLWQEGLTPDKQQKLIQQEPHALVPEERRIRQSLLPLREITRFYETPFLVGLDVGISRESNRFDRYNSAALVEPTEGNITGLYRKAHPVMFGEYVPFAKQFPQLYGIFPLPGGIEAGPVHQTTLSLQEWRLAPTICYESTVPHLVREQVAWNRTNGTEPDVILNLSNDGWFRGASALDFHMMCGVFRAIECRKPFLAAANTGLSVHVDSNGRVQWRGPRQANAAHIAEVQLDNRSSGYLLWGDWFAAACLLLASVVLIWSRSKPAAAPA